MYIGIRSYGFGEQIFAIRPEGHVFEFRLGPELRNGRRDLYVQTVPPCLVAERKMDGASTKITSKRTIFVAESEKPRDIEEARELAAWWARQYLEYIQTGKPIELPQDNGH
jgi:hypothetical protein